MTAHTEDYVDCGLHCKVEKSIVAKWQCKQSEYSKSYELLEKTDITNSTKPKIILTAFSENTKIHAICTFMYDEAQSP